MYHRAASFRRRTHLRLALIIVLLTLAVSFLQSSPAQAAVLLSNTGGTVAGSASLGLLRGNQIVVPAGTAYTLDSVSARIFPVTTPTVAFYVYNDSGGFPGSQIASLGSNSIPATGFYDFIPTTPFLLEPGQTYWILGQVTAGSAVWSATATAPTSGFGFTMPHQAVFTGGWGYDDGFAYNVFALNGTAAPTTTVSSINRANATPTNASSVSWTVTFANALSGLTSSNFTLAQTGVSGASITSVTPSGGAPATAWIVTANTGSGDGTLGLDMTSSAGLTTYVSNLTFTGQTYTIDKTPLSIVSISRADPDPTTGGTLQWTITLSEPINPSSLAIADFATPATGTVTYVGLSGFYTGGSTTVTIAASSVAGNGTLQLDFVGSLSDLAGNTLTTPFAGEFYMVANPTTVTSITRANASPTNATSVTWNVTFGLAVTGLTSSNFQLVPTGVTGASITSVSGSGTAWTVTADTGTGDGTLGLDMINDSGSVTSITNLPFTGQTYTIDKTPLSILSITRASPNPTTGGTLQWTITLSEPLNVSSLAILDFAAPTTGPVTYGGLSGFYTTGTTTVTIAASSVAGDGTLELDFVGSLSDLAGNTLTTPFAGEFYTVDNTVPTVTINQGSGQADPTSASPITFDVVFSETVMGFDASDIDLSASTVGGTLVASVSGSGATYTVDVTGMLGSGLVIASIPANAAQDTVGHLSGASTSSDNAVTFIDNVPSVTINQGSGQA